MKDATLAQGNQILNLILQKQVPADRIQKLIELGLLSDLLEANVERIDRDDFRKVIGLVPSILLVTVDYVLSLESMIKSGDYQWVHSDITQEHFPIKGEGRRELSVGLFYFDRTMESNDVISKMEKSGYRPATIQELLALGAKYPGLQKEYSIVAFGSIWQMCNGNRYAPYLLNYFVDRRRLSLEWTINTWYANTRFLAVHI